MTARGATVVTLPAGEPDAVRRRHVISALVVDRPGTLNRVAGLLRARSFNIESLTVGTTDQPGRSRMTIAVHGDDGHLRQVLAQLERLIDVLEVTDLTAQPRLELELALVELEPPRSVDRRAALDELLASAGGAVTASGADACRAYLAAPPDEIDRVLAQLGSFGLRRLVRAGAVAMATSATPEPSPTPHGATDE